jgi:hypothetical protein
MCVCVCQPGKWGYIYGPRVGSTTLEEAVLWRWMAGWPQCGLPVMHCWCTTSMASDSLLLPPGQHSHQVLIDSVPAQGRGATRVANQLAFEPVQSGIWSTTSPWVVHASSVHFFVTTWSNIHLSPRKTPFNLPIGPMGWERLGLGF